MLELARLGIARQQRVALSLREVSADKAAMKGLKPEVRDALHGVLTAADGFAAVPNLPPFVVDNATDTTIGAFDNYLEAVQTGLTEKVVRPLSEEQARKRDAATTVRERAFPRGTTILKLAMPLQYKAMVAMSDALLRDEACVAAIRELGCGWFVQHVVAHLKPYGDAVKASDLRDLDAVSDAFHAAMVGLMVQVSAHHAGDAGAQKLLMGAYETELDAQREEEREARKRRKKSKG